MLNDASGFEKIYIACGYSDLRRGIDGFANLIQREFKLDPFKSGILFLFCGRKTDRIKGLLWEGDGFLLLYKRLETGKFQWPRTEDEVKSISSQQYKWLMEGLAMDQKKAIKNLKPGRVL
jgi:transposase